MGDKKYLIFVGLASEILILQLGFFFAGRWLDVRLGWTPILEIAGPFLGLVLWMIHVIILAKAVARASKRQDLESRNN